MRLWTIHPRYLDATGLVAVWREGLLAQKVLRGATCGYRNHPQLARFKAQAEPLAAIAAYLQAIHGEAVRRGYRFDASKIGCGPMAGRIPETEGQLLYEWGHLKRKLRARAPALYRAYAEISRPAPHPLFEIVPGGVQPWERAFHDRV